MIFIHSQFQNVSQLVEGIVIDNRTKELIPGATVILFDGDGNEIASRMLGDDATFAFNLECNKEYLS